MDGIIIFKIWNVVVKKLSIERGFTKVEIGKKLVFISINGGSIFYGCKITYIQIFKCVENHYSTSVY